MATQNVPAKTEDRAVIYQSADGQEIKLTPEIVKKYLVQGKGDLVTTQELMYFLNICKARRLNPLTKDCYLIKYSQDPAAIVTSVDFFRKRARAQKDCKGWKKGVIVRTKDGSTRDSYGLVLEDETLVGGWFEAMPDGWLEPFRLEVNLSGYLKKTSDGKITRFWQPENQPTMIAKVAEAQGLRTLWPDEFHQLYTEEEGIDTSGNGGMPFIDITNEGAPDGPSDEDKLKVFAESTPEGTDPKVLGSFLEQTAFRNKATIDAVKIEATKDLKGFWRFFGAWVKQQHAKAAKNGKEPTTTVHPEEEPAQEMAPNPCPNHPENVFKKSYCDGCPERQGCPAWA
jgi:phage recombination protein Bet